MDVSTLQIISNTSVFIVFGILSGAMLAPWIIYMNSKQHLEDNVSDTNAILSATWYLALFYVIGIFYLFLTNETNVLIGLTPIGMMIAALIASASVMKNIAETKAHDIAKSEKEKARKRLFALNTMETINSILSSLETDIIGHKVGNLNDDFLPYVKTIKKLTDLVFTENTIQFLTDEERIAISNFHSQFYLFYSTYKQEIKEEKEFRATTAIQRLIKLTVDFKMITEKYLKISKDQ